MPMVTKLIRVATNCKKLSTINLHDPSIRSSCEDTWQIQQIISPLAENPWAQDYARCWLIVDSSTFKTQESLIAWSMWGHVRTWKMYISTFTRLTANNFGRMLSYRRWLNMKMLKLSPTFCLEDIFAKMKIMWKK